MKAIIAGPDDAGIGDAFEGEGVTVTRASGTADRPALEDAGIHEADLLVLTDTHLATAIPVAADLTEGVRVVVYAEGSLPEFVKGQAHIRLDPALFDPGEVAAELVDAGSA